jgi:hypothetical protein
MDTLHSTKLKQKRSVPGIAPFAAVLFARLEVGQVLLSLFRFPPNAPIQKTHNGDGDIESGNGCSESDVVVRFDELNITFVFRYSPFALDIWPTVDPGWPQQQTNTPSASERRFDSLLYIRWRRYYGCAYRSLNNSSTSADSPLVPDPLPPLNNLRKNVILLPSVP